MTNTLQALNFAVSGCLSTGIPTSFVDSFDHPFDPPVRQDQANQQAEDSLRCICRATGCGPVEHRLPGRTNQRTGQIESFLP
jgi:hypothetical protein